jgi:hypothetical protein
MTRSYKPGIIARCLGVITLSAAVPACVSPPTDEAGGGGMSLQEEHTGTVQQALGGTHKVCSAFRAFGSTFMRDSIVVDDGWSRTTCLGWTTSVSANEWNLGCLLDNGFSWGSMGGGIPNPNCGW